MSRAAKKIRAEKMVASTPLKAQQAGNGRWRVPGRAVCVGLIVLALVYAFLCGFHTVWDYDMGFHLATGRYIVQHHAIPITDVLSYTTRGAVWRYPALGEVVLYGIVSAFGYAGLSWFCALTMLAMIAVTLRSPARHGSGWTAALAAMAAPIVAERGANPRPDMFTELFFAVFLVLLWRQHESGPMPVDDITAKAAPGFEPHRLWLLPVLMVVLANCHPGFVVGLGIVVAYVLIEVLELLFPRRRMAALLRLKQAWPALATTFAATLVNPFGVKLFKVPLLLAGMSGQGLATDVVSEWQSIPITLTAFSQALDWRSPESDFWWLAIAGAAAIGMAAWRRKLGAAIVLAVAFYAATQHLRLKGMFAIVVVVVGGSVLGGLGAEERPEPKRSARNQKSVANMLAAMAAGALGVVLCVRLVDLTSNHYYNVNNSLERFGAGESWIFPERAAGFIRAEHLPGNVFEQADIGGFAAWRLGPEYPDFIDGRFDHLAPAVMNEEQDMLASSLDSARWKEEADYRNINVLLFVVTHITNIHRPELEAMCQSNEWRPIYMDEVSMVLIRNRPQNQPWIQRLEIDCQTHRFTPPTKASNYELANFNANSAFFLAHPGREREAAQAVESRPRRPSASACASALLRGAVHRTIQQCCRSVKCAQHGQD